MQIKRSNTTRALEIAYLLMAIIYAVLLQHSSLVLRNYFLVAILTFFCVFSIVHLGFKKDNSFLKIPVSRLIIANAILFALILAFVGVFTDFDVNAFSWIGFWQQILPTALIAIGIELFRSTIIGRHAVKTPAVIVFALITSIFFLANISSELGEVQAKFFIVVIFTTFWRVFTTEAMCAYLSAHVGFLPALIYRLVIALHLLVLPIWPKLGAPLTLIFAFAFPILTFIVVRHHELFSERHHAKARAFNYSFFTFPIIAILVFFVILNSGITGYRTLAIASNSMQPTYSRGDIVIYHKPPLSAISVGDILVFRRGDRIITHRVVEIRTTGSETRFIVKGDHNPMVDDYSVAYDNVYGVVCIIGHYIGYPALIFNNVSETEE